MGARLRQVVLVAAELEPVVERLRSELGLGEPFADPGVATFGLRNAVMAIGDCFVEVVSPDAQDTAAGRHLQRSGGDGGYMLMFDVPDIGAARRRAAGLGVRSVWEIDLPDISGTHLHPRDMGAAIVSIDQPRPPGSWRWAGPEWTGAPGRPAPGRLVGATVAAADPPATARRWGEILQVAVGSRGGSPVLELDGACVEFTPAGSHGERLVEFTFTATAGRAAPGSAIQVGGLRLRV